MLKIAICDNDAFICSHIEELIKNTLGNHHIDIEEFSNGMELYNSMKSNSYFDIIFIELFLKDMDGITTISHIQQIYNRKCLIFYMSGLIFTMENISEIIDTHPFAFLKKPIDQDYFIKKFLSAYQELFLNDEFFEFKSHGFIYKIPVNKIIYIEKSGRRLNIITNDTSYTTYCKIEDAYTYLLKISNCFVRIQYSYIVNLRYITKYTLTKIYMENLEFSISKNFRSDLFHSLHKNDASSSISDTFVK